MLPRFDARVGSGAALLFAGGALLFAADAWQTKPFTEWSDRDVNKVLTGSAWVKTVSIALGDMMSGGGGGRGRGGRGGGGGGGFEDAPARPVGDDLAGPGGGAPGGNLGSRGDYGGGGQAVPSMQLLVRWQSATPVKQALVRRRFGAEAATSPDAKKFLDDTASYIIAVAGFPSALARGMSPEMRLTVKQQTSLSVKGRPALQPVDVGMSPPGPQMEIFFVFPKAGSDFALTDKEVEFATKLGTLAVKTKFRLKDMVLNGTLEL